jgi:putative tryptophan/tyrosine transport system substrate-binding protein
MRRREFISLIGGAATAWSLAARAQQPPRKMRRLGVLQPGAPPEPLVEAMQGRLRELGYSERRDVAFEFRWAEGKFERLSQLATELADLKVDVITAFSTPAALAAQKGLRPFRSFSRRSETQLGPDSCRILPVRAEM